MQTWKLSEIESKLNLKFKRNSSAIGADIAEYKSGIAVVHTDNEQLYLDFLKVVEIPKNTKENLMDRLARFDLEMEKLVSEIKIKLIDCGVCEDCFLAFNLWTTKILARFETLFWKAFQKKVKLFYPFKMAVHARGALGFKTTKYFSCRECHEKFTEPIKKKVGRKFQWICPSCDKVYEKASQMKDSKHKNDTKQQVADWLKEKFNLELHEDNLEDAFILSINGIILKEKNGK